MVKVTPVGPRETAWQSAYTCCARFVDAILALRPSEQALLLLPRQFGWSA